MDWAVVGNRAESGGVQIEGRMILALMISISWIRMWDGYIYIYVIYSINYMCVCVCYIGFLGGTVVKNHPANAGEARDSGPVPGLGRFPAGGNGNPLLYSCLENSMNKGN